MSNQTLDTQKELTTAQGSKLQKYCSLVIGERGIASVLKYEIVTLLSTWIPGALGLWLRSKLYPLLLGSVGRSVVFGTNVVLRHPHKIRIQDNVTIDDNAVLDAKGDSNQGIEIGRNVFIGRNSIIYCQNGDIEIGDNANIGSNCQVFSAKKVVIGANVLMAAYSYLVGGGHRYDDPDRPIIEQGRVAKGIAINENAWLGAGVQILDGVTVGQGSIIAAGAVVTDDIPEYAIAGGMPARVLRDRRSQESD
jgi:acetyltransferase-like isoleucine patch superfamily enzyme